MPATPPGSTWPDRLAAVGAPLCEWLSRPRVRLTVTGVILLVVGGLVLSSSVWTLPLVIAGALMVVIAWVGRRIDGRFAVEWGETGTQLEFRAEIRAAHAVSTEPALMSSRARAIEGVREAELEDADVVEGEAHTVEIEVRELKALIAAVESAEPGSAQTEASARAKRSLRVADGGRSSEAAR